MGADNTDPRSARKINDSTDKRVGQNQRNNFRWSTRKNNKGGEGSALASLGARSISLRSLAPRQSQMTRMAMPSAGQLQLSLPLSLDLEQWVTTKLKYP